MHFSNLVHVLLLLTISEFFYAKVNAAMGDPPSCFICESCASTEGTSTACTDTTATYCKDALVSGAIVKTCDTLDAAPTDTDTEYFCNTANDCNLYTYPTSCYVGTGTGVATSATVLGFCKSDFNLTSGVVTKSIVSSLTGCTSGIDAETHVLTVCCSTDNCNSKTIAYSFEPSSMYLSNAKLILFSLISSALLAINMF